MASPASHSISAMAAGHAYPVLLDVRGKLVVIVGGGGVAVRKAAGLIEAGADPVRCVSPAFHPEMPGAVRRIAAAYDPSHLDGAALAFACTDSAEVNDAVVRDARSRGIWVNRADSDARLPGDFALPARLRQGAATVAVSAGSPALSALIRDGLARRWDPRWTAMADAMTALRPWVLAAGLAPVRRAAVFRDLASEAALEALAVGGVDALVDWLRGRHLDL